MTQLSPPPQESPSNKRSLKKAAGWQFYLRDGEPASPRLGVSDLRPELSPEVNRNPFVKGDITERLHLKFGRKLLPGKDHAFIPAGEGKRS